ncbi:MAG: glycosyltransferase [Leptolyngbya sp. SIO3F4]|nr:glycosyltransferase [Leptolyngbya sp. SIO3F4]
MPKVLIYRDQLLPYSETFIPAQGESLLRYQAIYVGVSRLTECLDTQKTILLGEIPAIASPLRRFWKGIYKLGGVVHPQWVEVLKQQQPTLMHAHFGSDGGLALPLCQRLEIPLVVTFHGYDATWDTPGWTTIRSQGDLFRALLLNKRDRALTKANRIIAVSKFIRHQLVLRGTAGNRIVVHYIGVDRQLFQPQLDQVREPIVLFVGRLVEKKGVEYLIRAMESVQRQISKAQLVIIGDGSLRSHLQTLAHQRSVRVDFLGKQSPDQVRYWMNRAQIFCGPSIIARSGDAEGFGMVFAEAQAMGLPVVSFATGGIPEAVIHGETGLLAPEKDIEQLSKNLIRLLEDAELREKFSLAGQAHVADNFDLQKNTSQLESIYDETVDHYQS